MELLIDNYRITRLDDLNIVTEQYVKLNPRNPYGRNGSKGANAKAIINFYNDGDMDGCKLYTNRNGMLWLLGEKARWITKRH